MRLMLRAENVITPREYYEYTHFSDAVMTDQRFTSFLKYGL